MWLSWFEENTVGLVSVLISTLALVVSFVLSRRTLTQSENMAKKYGDLAGTEAAIVYEEEKSANARITVLRALLNEIVRIRNFAEHNSKLGPHQRYAIKMPVTAFETSFFSKEAIGSDRSENNSYSELLVSVTQYLTEAHAINSLVDFHLTLLASPNQPSSKWGLQDVVKQKSLELAEILDDLEEKLGEELRK